MVEENINWNKQHGKLSWRQIIFFPLVFIAVSVMLAAMLHVGKGDSDEPSSQPAVESAKQQNLEVPTKREQEQAFYTRLSEVFKNTEKRWPQERAALLKIMDDPAFQRQRPLLLAAYNDADTLRHTHGNLVLQAITQNNANAAQAESFIHMDTANTAYAITEVFKILPRLERGDVIRDMNGVHKHSLEMLRECEPVLAAYALEDEQLHARYNVDIPGLSETSSRAAGMLDSVANHVTGDRLLEAYIIELHARMLVDTVSWTITPYQVEIYSKSHPADDRVTRADRNLPPLAEGVTLKAYQLVQNPFEYKRKLVGLDPNPWPQFLNGQVYNYFSPMFDEGRRRMRGAGYVGMRFNRMLSEGLVLYDCTGSNLDSSPGSGMEQVGQIIITLPANQNAPLDTDQIWEVEPLGTQQGTNQLGATISVPLVKFWQYKRSSAID